MKMSVSEVAHLLGVDRNLIKTWAFRFQEYLSREANPDKGVPRQFSLTDVQALAYVLMHWEDNPDFENIKSELHKGYHQEEPYSDILAQTTPLFQQPPDDLDETWQHGSLVGGIVNGVFDEFTLANSYKRAGDMLVDAALSNVEVHELIYPVIYNYRHATELYLKAVLQSKNRNHKLLPLLQSLRVHLKRKNVTVIPPWFENLVFTFADFDPNSTTFRYGDSGVFSRSTGDGSEFWIDLPHLKKLMGWAAESFQRILQAQQHV